MNNIRGLQQQRVAPSSRQNDEEIIDLQALLSAIWRGKFWIMLAMIVGLFLGAIQAYVLATPMYRSTAVVMLNNREEQIIDRGGVISALGTNGAVLRTEVEVLQSRSLLGKVVDELNLMQDPEFNAALRPPSTRTQIRNWLRGLVTSAPADTSAEPAALTPAQERRRRESTINRLLSSLTVENVAGSLVFEVTVETTDPEKSAEIADTLVDLYIVNQLEVKFEASEQATSWLTDRVADLQMQLEEAESEVTDFRANTSLVSSEALSGLEVQVKDTRDRIASITSNLEGSRARLEALRAAETPQEQVDVTGDLQLQRLLPRIDEPEIAQSFETRFQQIVTRLESDIARDEAQLSTLQESLATLEAQRDRQSEDLITLQQLTREAEATRLLYEYFLGRLKETSAQQGIQQADSRVISSAVIPNGAASPRKKMILAISMVLGAVVGTALVLLREARSRSFRTAEQLESITGYATVGQVPMISSRRQRRRDTVIYLKEKPSSAAAEAIRNLRTSVMLSNLDTPPKVIMVSSSLSGEGKSTVALSLALNFSTMGKKVLVIEGDIRRRVFGQYLNTEQSEGVVAVLTGTHAFDDVVVHDELLGADVLLGDNAQVNAADVFSSERFSNLLEEMRRRYDIVIVDTPPVLLVPDARVIAQHVDATIFVVRWDQTQREQVVSALREFESVGAPVSGLVLNQISPRGMRRYGYGSSYGPYANYGSKYYVN